MLRPSGAGALENWDSNCRSVADRATPIGLTDANPSLNNVMADCALAITSSLVCAAWACRRIASRMTS
ncbi:hypothetical protein D3C72_1789840 [compost metagenome]